MMSHWSLDLTGFMKHAEAVQMQRQMYMVSVVLIWGFGNVYKHALQEGTEQVYFRVISTFETREAPPPPLWVFFNKRFWSARSCLVRN